MIHILKCGNPYFQEMWIGLKNFEIRKNDRDFQNEDILWLREMRDFKYTGRALKVLVWRVYPLGMDLLMPRVIAMTCVVLRRVQDYEHR